MSGIYECQCCGAYFDEPEVKETTYESYYGLDFPNSNPMRLEVCPCCQADDIYEMPTYEVIDLLEKFKEARKCKNAKV